MCRTREEIIQTDPTLQDLCIFIEQQEEKLRQGKNGNTHFELAQARISLDTRIAQIQDREDTNEKLDEVEKKRADNHKKLEEIDTKLDLHIKDYTDHPSLRKAIAKEPLKTLLGLSGVIVTAYTVLWFVSTALVTGTGFDVLFKTFIEGILLP